MKKNYTEFIKSYKNVKRIFIGKSVKGDDAYASFPNNSSAAAKFGLGNSILLQISTNRYAFIGESVYEFETPDLIEEYYSMIGGNDVPYPIAVGSKNVYFLIFGGNDGYLSKKYFEDFPQKHSWALDSYARLWGQNKFTDSLIKYTKKIPKIKIVQSIGRGLRLHIDKKELIIFDIADNLRYGQRHVEQRLTLYDAEQIKYTFTQFNETKN